VALVKPEFPWYYECSKSAPQEALRALRHGIDALKRLLAPKFKKKGQQDSFTLEGAVKVLVTTKFRCQR